MLFAARLLWTQRLSERCRAGAGKFSKPGAFEYSLTRVFDFFLGEWMLLIPREDSVKFCSCFLLLRV